MQAAEQGTREPGRRRYLAVPRTLIFVTSVNPANGVEEVLLLKGAPTKRLWANRYNGLGGHVEADEDVLSAAHRELREEAGLDPARLTLVGVVNIDTGADEQGPRPGVLVFVFHTSVTDRMVHPTAEGTPAWFPLTALAGLPLVADLPDLIPRALAGGPPFFGHYTPRPDGTLEVHFR